MTAPTTTALQALLQPWRETFRSMRVCPVPDRAGSSDSDEPRVRLKWDYPRDDPGSFMRLLEAIELYTRLEGIDRDAWWNETQALINSGYYAYSWRQLIRETWPLPRVSGHTLVVHQFEDAQPVCECLCRVETEGHAFSPEYQQVRRVFQEAMPEGTREAPLSMGLSFDLSLDELRRVWELLPLLTPLATAHAASPSGDIPHHARLECVDLPPAIFAPPVPPVALEQLLHLCRHGVAIDTLPMLELTLTRAHAATFVTTVKELLGSRQGGYGGRTRRASFSAGGEEVYAVVASATMDAPAIDDVHAILPEEGVTGRGDRTRKLRWLAYALFSCQATANAAKVTLGCASLTTETVGILEELLGADEPLALLFGDLATSIHERKPWRLGASRFVLYDPTIPADEAAVLDDRWYNGLRVLGAMGDWWVVFLPGWGKAWVHTGDATVSRAAQAEQKITGVKAITHLSLNRARDAAATAALLRLIGAGVTHLTVTDLPGMDAWCPAIFHGCPRLQELYLGAMTADRLATVFEWVTRNTATDLEYLTLEVLYLSDENLADVIAALDALADRHHPLSKQLRGFGACSSSSANFGIAITSPELFASAARMLKHNKTLEYLRLQLPVSVRTAVEAATLGAALDQPRRQQLPLEANQISVRQKAAFLSVLSAPHSTRAMRELDRGVISTILDFAPKPRYRSVDIAPPQVA